MFKDKHDDKLKNDVKTWWNDNPFTYLIEDPGESADWAFFRNIDRKIIKWAPWAQSKYPLLSGLIDYSTFKNKHVLDIGIGTGWTTEQFLRAGAEVTGIDITPRAIELARRRLDIFNLDADLMVADAENLPFPDNHFDYVLAWGCLMHTPNTQKAIEEIFRVLKPDGHAAAMMYNKNSLHWKYYIWFGKGILKMRLLKYNSQELANRYTDGADIGGNMLTKFYSPEEVKNKWTKFREVKVSVKDAPSFIDPFPHRTLPLGKILPLFVKQKLAQIWGQTLWVEARK